MLQQRLEVPTADLHGCLAKQPTHELSNVEASNQLWQFGNDAFARAMALSKLSGTSRKQAYTESTCPISTYKYTLRQE